MEQKASLPLQKLMRAHVRFAGNFVLLLHWAAVLSAILMLRNSALKVVSRKNYSKVGIILEVNNEVIVET